MSVYLDSSALAKLLRPEQDHEIARAAFDGAGAPATSAISYPELCATVAVWESRQASPKAHRARNELERSWPALFVIGVDEAMAHRAGMLALRHRLRGMDAIHVASALEIAGDSPATVSFVSWDRDQRKAARQEGLSVVPEEL